LPQFKFDVRRVSQAYFLLLYIVAGYLFYLAVTLAPILGTDALQYRFPAIEGFLPISALVGVKQLITLGNYDPVHPAGLTILLLAVLSALLLKRGFCSHICSIGTLSDLCYKGQSKLIGTLVQLPKWLDTLLKTPKYFLLLFLLYVVLIGMSGIEAATFIRSPYNIISDAKMLTFFQHPSVTTLQVVATLVVLSLVVQNFWCRYLCPYGALLNVFALFSPVTLCRDESKCKLCRQCDAVCPSNLTISRASSITSPDCTLCQSCVKRCPAQTLTITERITNRPLQPAIYSLLLIAVFAIGITLAKLTGHWESTVLPLYWVEYLPFIELIGH
jgi:polyferredoxin